jgi:hypothetical protein
MRSLHLLAGVALLGTGVGCNLIGKMNGNSTNNDRHTPVQKVTPEQLVKYLNDRAERLQTLDYGEVRMSAREGLITYPALRGDLVASQPNYFRMAGVGGAMGAKVDLGSNDQQFWVYFDAPTMKPMYVFASHTDFDAGRAKLPGNIPFEPHWVMQALGMMIYPPNLPYTADANERDRTYTLSWAAKAPNGMAVRKEVVFDADEARDGRPQVKKHLIRDAKNRVICSAEVRGVRSVALGGPDPRSTQLNVQYPTHIVLRWEEQRVELSLELQKAQVNEVLTEERRRQLFTKRSIPGVTPIDLAQYTFSSK